MHRTTAEIVFDGFTAAFGAEPEGVWSAPGRVSLMGDHTDIEDGLTFGFTYEARSAVAVRRREDDLIRIVTDLADERVETRIGDLAPPQEHSWKDYPLGMIWVIRNWIAEHPVDEQDAPRAATGLDLFLTTDVPIGGGLASSASLCAALSIALNELWDLQLGRDRLARFGFDVENVYIGSSSGMSDHVTVLCGDVEKDVFYDARGNDVSLIDAPPLAEQGFSALVVETGETHRNWAGTVNDRHEACERVARALGCQSLREAAYDDFLAARDTIDESDWRRANYIMTEIPRVLDLTRLLRTEGAPSVGDLFTQSQRSLRDDFDVSTQRVEAVCEIALAGGATGARMTGSGFGGAVFVLLPTDRVETVRGMLTEAFAEYGWEGLEIYQVRSAPGSRRDR